MASSRSTWDRLYDWLVEQGYGPHDRLHSNTYVGDGLMKRLLAAEGERIRKKEGYLGDKLKAAVSFSNVNAGPMETHEWCRLVGDALFVRPDERSGPSAQR